MGAWGIRRCALAYLDGEPMSDLLYAWHEYCQEGQVVRPSCLDLVALTPLLAVITDLIINDHYKEARPSFQNWNDGLRKRLTRNREYRPGGYG